MRFRLRRPWRTGALLLLGFAIAAAGIAGAEKTANPSRSIDELLLFFPAKYPVGDWNPPGLRFQDVYFKAADGTQLHGWYCPSDNPRAVILIAHGNGGHIAGRATWLEYLQSQAHVSAFMFDYRGYGRSSGKPSVAGALQDARAARAKLRELAGVEDSQMQLMGESLGGAIVVQLAAESAPRALILQSTFPSLREVAAVHYSKLSWLVSAGKLNSAAAIARYQGPLLQSHGTDDEIVPLPLAEKLYRAAHEPKRFVTLRGAGHNDWLSEEYFAELDAFLTATLQAGP